MKDADPYTFVSWVIVALFVGFIVGGLAIGLAFRTRLLDEGERGGGAYRDLLAVAKQCASPDTMATLLREAATIWDRSRPDGIHLDTDALWRGRADIEPTPAYVHRIVEAYDTGDPIDLSGCWVPPDVEGRLRVIKFGASPPMAWPTAVDRWPTQRGPSDG